MLRTTPTRSAENLPSSMDRAEDAEVGSGTSSTTRSAKNLSTSMDMVEDAEVGEGDGGDDKTVEDHLFPRSQTYLWGILPPYAPTLILHRSRKDEFSLIVLTMVEALS